MGIKVIAGICYTYDTNKHMTWFRRVCHTKIPGMEANACKVTLLVVFIAAALTYIAIAVLDRFAALHRLATLNMVQAFFVFALLLAVISAFTFVLLILAMDVSRQKDPGMSKHDPLKADSTAEFFSIVSHQLRSPLSAIRWLSELLKSEAKDRLNEKELGYIDDINEQSRQMIKLINSLLRMTGLEMGKVSMRTEEVNILNLVQSVVNEHRKMHTASISKIVLHKPKAALPPVEADKELLRQVFANIINNAMRYSKAGRGIIDVSFSLDNEDVVVSVKDQGIGIPQSAQSKIFNKYYRAPNAVKVQTQGTGLGLYISRMILTLQGGRIWFTSEENKGSTFYVALPMKR